MKFVTVDPSPDSVAVEREAQRPVRLPAEYNEYVLAVAWLRESGVWDWAQSRVLGRRAGSYELCDLVLLLCCFFTAGAKGEPIAGFCARSSQYGPELAAIGDRDRWITQSSVSRALDAIGLPLAQELSRRMLGASNRFAADSVACQTAGHLDGVGDTWFVGHWDTKVTTMRKRALPEGEDLPEPIRRVDDSGLPGYPGRKRGEVQFSRSLLQDSAAGAWINLDIEPGNGALSDQIARTADAAIEFLGGPDSPKRERAVVVCDGVGGGTISARELHARGLHFLTRASNYQMLETVRVAAKLNGGGWQPVDDSRSGPKREALDIGTRSMFGGSPVRVVATRFPARTTEGRKKRGSGRTIGKWQYELFITTLPTERWGAADAVTLYYGRTAIENRFAAENREFGLDRVFAFNGPGQTVACAVAMANWNLRLLGGIASMSDTEHARNPRVRPVAAVEEPMELPPEPAAESTPAGPKLSETRLDHEQATAPAALDHDAPAPDVDISASRNLQLQTWAQRHTEWSVDEAAVALICPAGETLSCCGTRENADGMLHRYRAPTGVCRACTKRRACSPGTAWNFRKEVTIRTDDGRAQPRPCQAVPAPPTFAVRERAPELPPLIPSPPMLLAAKLRRTGRAKAQSVVIWVQLPKVPARPKLDEHVVETVEDRQRRRQTIPERIAANAHPDPGRIGIRVEGTSEFMAWHAAVKRSFRSA